MLFAASVLADRPVRACAHELIAGRAREAWPVRRPELVVAAHVQRGRIGDAGGPQALGAVQQVLRGGDRLARRIVLGRDLPGEIGVARRHLADRLRVGAVAHLERAADRAGAAGVRLAVAFQHAGRRQGGGVHAKRGRVVGRRLAPGCAQHRGQRRAVAGHRARRAGPAGQRTGAVRRGGGRRGGAGGTGRAPQFTAGALALISVTVPLAAAAAAAFASATRASAEQRHICCSCAAVVAACAFCRSRSARSWLVCACAVACSPASRAVASAAAFTSVVDPRPLRNVFRWVRRCVLLFRDGFRRRLRRRRGHGRLVEHDGPEVIGVGRVELVRAQEVLGQRRRGPEVPRRAAESADQRRSCPGPAAASPRARQAPARGCPKRRDCRD